ncbi:MAG: ATPase [Bacteroidetes bacterium]|nr:ATPase [Bacteroidota bacterium]
MIVPMLKYSFLVYHKEYESFLNDLRDLGVVHVSEKQKDVSDEIRDKYDQIRQINSIIKELQKREISTVKTDGIDGEKAFEEVQSLLLDIEQKQQQLSILKKEIQHIQPWGNFNNETINNLKDNGVFIKFFTVSIRKFDAEWEQKYPIQVINQQSGLTYFVLFHKEGEEIEIDAEEMRAPEHSVAELVMHQQNLENSLEEINKKLDKHAAESIDAIEKHFLSVIEITDYKKVIENTQKEAEDKIMMLEGWAPEHRSEELNTFMENNKILFISEKPDKVENAPILLKNQKFARKFEVLGELYSLPKYDELDLTPFFAPFYMLFFGFCLGDVGYGLILAIGALVAKGKVKKEMKQVMSLVFYLGLSTILFGLIGGTFFGIPLYDTNLPIYRDLAVMFKEKGTDINQILFNLSLVLGGIQIIFGLIIKVFNEIKQLGISYAIGTIGWVILLLGIVIIALVSHFAGIPMEELKTITYALVGVSGVMILLLNNLKRNIFMNVGVGLWGVYNMATGILGDMLSYIRLFALGISSAIMGFVFNSLAVSMSGSIPVLNIVIMIIILVIGHAINIFMSGLGAFVHPMRLTFVEFYKNAGFSGGGKKYNPFRKLT